MKPWSIGEVHLEFGRVERAEVKMPKTNFGSGPLGLRRDSERPRQTKLQYTKMKLFFTEEKEMKKGSKGLVREITTYFWGRP